MPAQTLAELRTVVRAGPPYDEGFLRRLAEDGRAGARALHRECLRRIAAAEQEAERATAMLRFENEAREAGYQRVAGVDEAGRGPLAGPLVAAAVVLGEPIPGLNDSKQLKPGERERLFDLLHKPGHSVALGVAQADTIDFQGIQSANYHAMEVAARELDPAPDCVLVDGFTLPSCAIRQIRLRGGDRRSMSIAAASIVAKVTRDRLMVKLDEAYPGYGFARNKGYPTAEHIAALRAMGPCPAHRRSFAPVAEAAQQHSAVRLAGKALKD
ncbi:MAG: ribonuclease HII [Candidatus Hydrogenedentota bacterium]